MVFAAAGAVDHDAVLDGVAGPHGRAPAAGIGRPRRRPPDAVAGGRPGAANGHTEQAHLVVRRARPRPATIPQRHAAAILDHVLGGGMSSRLFQSIREDRGLAYSVYSYRPASRARAALAVYAGTTPVPGRRVLGLINDELDRIADGRRHRCRADGRPVPSPRRAGPRDGGLRGPHEPHRPRPAGPRRVPDLDEVVERLVSVTADEVNQLAAELLFR